MRSKVRFGMLLAGVALALPASAAAQTEDPDPGSPSGTIYEIPLDDGRSDAAPREPRRGPRRRSSLADPQPDNGFGSSSTVPGSEPEGTPAPDAAGTPATGGGGSSNGSGQDGRASGGGRPARGGEGQVPPGVVRRERRGDRAVARPHRHPARPRRARRRPAWPSPPGSRRASGDVRTATQPRRPAASRARPRRRSISASDAMRSAFGTRWPCEVASSMRRHVRTSGSSAVRASSSRSPATLWRST